MVLLEMGPLKEVIKLVLQTGYIKHAKSSSLLIIAQAESGKTETMEEFKHLKGVYYTNDITPKLLTDKIFPMVDEGKITHLVIPDILNCVERNRATRMHFINLMKTLIEEGITRTDAFHLRFEPRYKDVIQCGLITAITGKSYSEFRSEWIKIGFLSRMIPVSFTYSIDKVKKIFDFIAEEDYMSSKPKHNIIRKRSEVKGNPILFKNLEMIASSIGKKIDAHGIRMQKNLQNIAKANALLNGRLEVQQTDIDKVFELSKWINYDFHPL